MTSLSNSKMVDRGSLCLKIAVFVMTSNNFLVSQAFLNVMNYGKYLPQNIITQRYSVSLVECARDCASRRSCQSVNYQRRYTRCILNNVTVTSSGSVNETDEDMAYLDITEWPETLRTCNSSTCKPGHRCSNNSSGGDGCKPSECEAIVYVDHGTMIEYGQSVGDVLTYICDVGYTRNYSQPSLCQENGQWSYPPVCYRKECNTVPQIPDATPNTTAVSTGTVVGYSCKVGYRAEGTTTATCTEKREWTLANMTCVKDDCYTGYSVILEVDVKGNVLQGSKVDLLSRVKTGISLRLLLTNVADNVHHILDATSVSVFDKDDVAVTSIYNDQRTSGMVRRRYFTVSSDGTVNITEWKIGAMEWLSSASYRSHVTWHVSSQPLRTLYWRQIGGTTDSFKELLDMTKAGAEIQVYDMESQLYSPGSVSYSANGMSLQNAWNLETFNGDISVSFNLYWSVTLFNPKFEEYMFARWKTETISNGGTVSAVTQAHAWICNACWEFVYENDSDGVGVRGSLAVLLSKIIAGHRVRVNHDGRIEEAVSIRVLSSNRVVVQTLDSVHETSNREFRSSELWRVYRMLSTDGNVTIYRCGFSNTCHRLYQQFGSVIWFVDKASWVQVFERKVNDTLVTKKDDMIWNLLQGGKTRLHISSMGLYVNADHISIYGGEVVAASVKHIAVDETSPYDISSEPSWAFYYVTTSSDTASVIKMFCYKHGISSTKDTLSNVTWFINAYKANQNTLPLSRGR